MDRIEKFLKRRPVKNKRRVKCNGREYVVTKEDVKRIRSFRKNTCMDPDVDLYRPLNLSFSRKTMTSGLPIREKRDISLEVQEKLVKRYRNSVARREEQSKNEIVDVWESETLEDLDKYDQDMFVKIDESYSGCVEELEYGESDLARGLRRTYLRLYEPRERKTYRLKDLMKELPKPEELRPFPEEVGLWFEFEEAVRMGISPDFQRFAAGCGALVRIYEFKNFVKVKSVTFDEEVRKVVFTKDEAVCVMLKDRVCVVGDVYSGVSSCEFGTFGYEEFVTWERRPLEDEGPQGLERSQGVEARIPHTVIRTCGKINGIEVHGNGKYIGAVCGKTVVLYDLENRSAVKVVTTRNVIPLKVRFHRTRPMVMISTSNSLMVHDLVGKKTVCEMKESSFVLDFFNVTEDTVLVANNLKRIMLFDHSRNVVVRTMVQEDMVSEVIQHGRYNLMCAVSSREMTIFYHSVGENMVVPVKRIAGRYRQVRFHPLLPWLYATQGRRVVVFT